MAGKQHASGLHCFKQGTESFMVMLKAKAGELVERFIEEAISAGLTWDEVVAVFGLASKALAQAAVAAGEGAEADCVAHARKRLEEAFAQDVRVVMADGPEAEFEAESGDNALLATAHRRHAYKH
ncbi:hypothetical protein [Paraburkholderia unamae]|uniref:hypothetical protein n=1 Tax=Paraburkholderia unamae TaxID=219649 RepID=UPI0011BDB6E4|nr:hypothetical protein [Paraburkholderia unamae]